MSSLRSERLFKIIFEQTGDLVLVYDEGADLQMDDGLSSA